MPTRLNLCANGYLVPPLGYNLRLSPTTSYYASGPIPVTATSISAVIAADGQADVHMALYSAPLTVGASDSVLLTQVDSTGVLTADTTLTLTVPDTADLISDPVAQTGTITISASSQSVSGSGTAFPVDGQWTGYEIGVKGGSWYQVASVASTTALTLANIAASISAASGAFYLRRPKPIGYVVVIWADNVVGSSVETVARDTAITNIAGQAQIPGGVTVSSIMVDF